MGATGRAARRRRRWSSVGEGPSPDVAHRDNSVEAVGVLDIQVLGYAAVVLIITNHEDGDEFAPRHAELRDLHRVPDPTDGGTDVWPVPVLKRVADEGERDVALRVEAQTIRRLLVTLEVDVVLLNIERALVDGELPGLWCAEHHQGVAVRACGRLCFHAQGGWRNKQAD
jgi:hypothetical protein